MLCYYFSSRARLTAFGWTVIIATVIFASVSMCYYYLYLGNGITSRYLDGFTRIQTNVIGYATLFAALLSLQLYRCETRRFHRILLAVCLAVTLAASVMGQSRGTLLAVAVSFFILIKSKRLFLILLAGLVLFVAMFPIRERLSQTISYYDRLYPAFYSIEIIKDHPIVGAGYSLDALGDSAYIDPAVYGPRVPAWVRDPRYILPANLRFVLPHSLFLNIPVRTGLVGLALYLALLFVFAREGWRLYTKGSDRFIRSWGLLCLAAMGMYVTKGAVEPVDTAMVEVILYSIFAMLTIAWFLEKEVAVRPAENLDRATVARGAAPVKQRTDRPSSPLA